MAELEPLSANPFAPTQDQQVGYAKCYMDAIKGSCTSELRVGFFFDGTNNNKYRDTPKQANSNVARLHDIYEANQDQLRYYVPGIGTPFEKETSDTGRGYHARAGLGAGWGGEARINWALLQVTDALYRRYFDRNLSVEMGTNDLDVVRRISTDLHLTPAYLAAAGNDEVEQLSNASTGLTIASVLNTATAVPRHQQRRDELKRRREFVSQKVKPLLASQKPTMQRIRLYVFGFSRGAAEARVFSNWLKDALDDDMTLAGLKVEFDFLGIFDTVASVGLAQSSMIADGHGSWGKKSSCASLSTSHAQCILFPHMRCVVRSHSTRLLRKTASNSPILECTLMSAAPISQGIKVADAMRLVCRTTATSFLR